MSYPPPWKSGFWLPAGIIIVGMLALTVGALLACAFIPFPPFRGGGASPTTIVEASKKEVDPFYVHFHKYPPPNSFPQSCWR
jgi:hypothetical protein